MLCLVDFFFIFLELLSSKKEESNIGYVVALCEGNEENKENICFLI